MMSKNIFSLFSMLVFVSGFAVARNFKSAMDSLLNDKLFTESDVSVAVYDLDEDSLMYAFRSAKMCRPASVMKLFTTAIALERLGTDYTVNTVLGEWSGKDSVGKTFRNLCVRGEIDPLFSENDLLEMVAALNGNSVIDTLFADCSFMDSVYWGPGWSWDDTPWDFQPYISPLMLNGGCVDISVQPSSKGEPPLVKCVPESSYFTLVNEAESYSSSLGKLTVMRDWLDNSNVLRVRGNCNAVFGERMNMFRSERFFITVLCERLAARGIHIGAVSYMNPSVAFDTLYIKHRPITDIVDKALSESDNLCAESLSYHLGALYGHRPVAQSDGTKIMKGFMNFNFKMPEKYEIADGSGLSLYSYVSADIMLQLLNRVYKNKSIFDSMLHGLPVSGRTGTLKGRMIGGVAENRIHAKTGTVSGICTLAGYAEAKNGHLLAFVIFNQNVMNVKAARRWQNKVCELLCR